MAVIFLLRIELIHASRISYIVMFVEGVGINCLRFRIFVTVIQLLKMQSLRNRF